MGKQALQGTAVALCAAGVAFVFLDQILMVSRGNLLHPMVVVEGLLFGAAVLVSWRFVRTRIAAASGLVVMAAIVGVGVQGEVTPALRAAQAPLSWAVMLAFVVRLATATSSLHETGDSPQAN